MSGALARSILAHHLCAGDISPSLGEVVLAPHQLRAAERILHLLRRHRGALLADDVGLGKTFVALAVSRAYRQVLILHPAALRGMWVEALRRAGTHADLVSYESLSRRMPPGSGWDLAILDEAHHARSTHARRYPRIAALTAKTRTLLLSATPIPNRTEELRALFALFMGERAHVLDASSARALIVRRTGHDVPAARIPARSSIHWLDAPDDAELVAELQALPPPVPLCDGGDARVLLTYVLVRQWASSRAALHGALRRRVARALALDDLLAAGRLPGRRQLDAWTMADDAVQLAMAGLLGESVRDEAARPCTDIAALRASTSSHRAALQRLIERLVRRPDPDAARAALLRALRHEHPGEKLLAFTEYAATARAYWRALRAEPGVALLTARGGMIASGAISRTCVLDRFAPMGQRRSPPPAIESISLLVTTDLIAEGVDLRDATVVVHLDLPWSPARLEQRVGRARRLGSSAGRVAVYAMRPPHAADALLAMEQRLRDKIATARAAVGWSPDALSAGHGGRPDSNHGASAAEQLSTLLDRIACWRSQGGAPRSASIVVTVVSTALDGWLALVTIDGEWRLVTKLRDELSDHPAMLARAVALAETARDHEPAADGADVARCLAEACQWAAARAAEGCVSAPRSNGVTRLMLDRLARVHASMPHERRAADASLLAAARVVAIGPHPAGLEHELDRLTRDAALDDAAWLRAVTAAADARTPSTPSADVAVLIVFVRAADAISPARAPATRS